MNSLSDDKIIQIFQQMADLTLPECRKCPNPLSCCSPEYCEMAIDYARNTCGVTLERTEHPKLPLMGESGCTVAPHLRPLCSLHTCEINSMGLKRGDKEWTEKYFQLRVEIEEAMPI